MSDDHANRLQAIESSVDSIRLATREIHSVLADLLHAIKDLEVTLSKCTSRIENRMGP